MTATIVDSIAVQILNDEALITGVGNELHLHTNCTNVPQQVLSIKLRDKVHGIVQEAKSEADILGDDAISATKLIVYGEKEFMLLQYTQQFDFELVYRANLSDWISAAKFLQGTKEFVLLTAHSVILRLSYRADDLGCKLIEKSSCSDKSTLYCSYVQGSSWDDLVVFGGNAFGELLIWKPALMSNKNGKLVATLLHRVQMHNGVIFSICYNEKSQYLTTTSDDRSIRFWKVEGVLESEKGRFNWSLSNLIPISSGYGHTARVFQGKIIEFSNQQYAVTVGEDSYICVWRINGELIFKRRQQFGATIWNFEYDPTTHTLYTVGSTGNMLAYYLKDVLENRLSKMVTLPPLNLGVEAEYVAKIKFLTKHMLIGVTNKNRMIFKDLRNESEKVEIEKEDHSEWQLINDFDAWIKCTVLEVYENYIVLCGYKRLRFFKYNAATEEFEKLYDGEILDGVIRAFHFLNAAMYLVSDDLGNCMLIKGDDMLLRYSLELPKCKECWLTTALAIDDEFLLCSNRQGNLLLYEYTRNIEKYELKNVLKHPHGNLGSTALKLIESSNQRALVKSAGHDGMLTLLCVDKRNALLSIHSHENVPVAWVEHLIHMTVQTSATFELILGFNDNHFVAWSKLHDFAVQIPCGGGHRCWDFYIIEEDTTNWLKLVFIKTKQVLFYKLRLFNSPQTKIQLPVRNTWHIKCCNTLTLLPTTKQNKTDETVISAGDDNLIKISTHNINTGDFTQISEVHTHISNIRALKVLQPNDDYCLIFSGGGRAQLCITKLYLKSFHIEEKLNYILRSPSKERTQKYYSFDPDTRIMSVDVLAETTSEFHIFLGCSDGFVRKLILSNDFEVRAQTESYYGKCVLQVRLVASLYVMIATTDGNLNLYDLDLTKKHLILPHHASGINALDIDFDSDAKILHILTGGDDQDVVYTKLDLDTLEILKHLHMPLLHTAQVTGARLSRRTLGGQLYAMTTSVDQNLCKYNLETEDLEQVFHSCVADVKGLCLNANQLCFLYGCGLQIYNFNS